MAQINGINYQLAFIIILLLITGIYNQTIPGQLDNLRWIFVIAIILLFVKQKFTNLNIIKIS
jgi:hypothetical protein